MARAVVYSKANGQLELRAKECIERTGLTDEYGFFDCVHDTHKEYLHNEEGLRLARIDLFNQIMTCYRYLCDYNQNKIEDNDGNLTERMTTRVNIYNKAYNLIVEEEKHVIEENARKKTK